jgi:DNA-binding transcriptional ArsR family regulator
MVETLSAPAVEVFRNIPRNDWATTGELTDFVSVQDRTIRRYLEDFEEKGLVERRRTGTGHADPVRRTAGEGAVRSKVDAKRSEPAKFCMVGGYEYGVCTLNEADSIPIHRLVAIAEYGVDAVAGREIHHKNGIKWDNRPSNLTPLDREAHARHHSFERMLSEINDAALADLLEGAGYTDAAALID